MIASSYSYGAEPSVAYFASPVSVDNVSGQILAD